MTRTKRRAMSIVVAAFACVAVGASAAEMHHQVVTPDAVKWGPPPPGVPGGAMAVLSGDPTKEGLFVVWAKFPPGYAGPPHWHSMAEHVTILSGSAYMGMGDTLDKTKGQAIPVGSFVFVPAKTRHYIWTDVEVVVQITAMGPFDIHYVNPKDDPRTGMTGTR